MSPMRYEVRRWFALPAVFSLFGLLYFVDGNPAWFGYLGFLGFLGFLAPQRRAAEPARM